MRRLLLIPAVAAAMALLAGCASLPLGDRSRSAVVDSLRSENATLRARLQEVRDSIEFQEGVETGQYYRDRRVLRDRLNRLTYELRTLRDGGLTVAVLRTDSLFDPGTTSLTAAGVNRLRATISHLESAYPNQTIRVEGHADNTPLGEDLQARYASNWELSAARATAVVRHLSANSDLGAGQFVAVAYGATDPIASNETAAGRRQNRRVRIAVLPTPRDYSRPFETAW